MYAKIVALLFPLLAVATPVPVPQSQSAAGQITITGSSYSGSGCPPSSVSTTISPDKTVLTYGLEQMWAYIGPNAKPGEQTRNCQITLNLQYDGEIQLAVLSGAYHGWARFDAGITGTISTTYTADSKTRTTTGKSLSGPEYVEGQVYTKEDSLETSPIIWTPCTKTGSVVIENRLSLSSRNSASNGEMSIDDATAAFSQQVAVRRC